MVRPVLSEAQLARRRQEAVEAAEAWKRRNRNRSGMTASPMPLPPSAEDDERVVLPSWEDPEIERRVSGHIEREGLGGE